MTLLISPRTQDIGFTVKRLLPSRLRQRVGPFIFVDHMGPAQFEPGTTAGDVRQHPHIGLATVTYLFSGAMMHKDSLGVHQRIEPGAINLMTAGSGIVHSERLPEDVREQNTVVEGMQLWLALPTEVEDCEPSFAHYGAEEIPSVNLATLSAQVLIGKAFDVESPVKTASVTTYIDFALGAGAKYVPNFPQQELAIYVAQGNVTVNGEEVPEFHLAVLSENDVIETVSGARILLLGGEPLVGERYIHWNFVSSSRDKLKAAGERWTNGGFAMVPGETDWIPLPV
ncbi:pirin family protein [Cellvibrio sp. OA-2007]|uniref:pirin family protein n=1 Tax=Cellvibrio sp. OA-2007 TaxID=529823 RepID=UPI0007846137|nr:pirin family protein [Cellvibrio sp. OA-2007]